MDTTYWGRDFDLLVIKDTFRNKTSGTSLSVMSLLATMWRELDGSGRMALPYMG